MRSDIVSAVWVSRMLARQRQREILNRLRVTGSVRVADLARRLHVTEETIRRDLEKLEAAGKLVRAHGGALPLEAGDHELPFDVRKTANLTAKRSIAAAAARFVADGDVIALDASTTAHELARSLPDFAITVVTNSLVIASSLAGRSRIRAFCTGGALDRLSLSLVGSLAEDSLNRFHIAKAFLSCKGFDPARGLSVASDEHARMKRRMLDVADKTYLLADHSKFGVSSVVIFANLTDIDCLITDGRTDDGLLETIRLAGVAVERAGGDGARKD